MKTTWIQLYDAAFEGLTCGNNTKKITQLQQEQLYSYLVVAVFVVLLFVYLSLAFILSLILTLCLALNVFWLCSSIVCATHICHDYRLCTTCVHMAKQYSNQTEKKKNKRNSRNEAQEFFSR